MLYYTLGIFKSQGDFIVLCYILLVKMEEFRYKCPTLYGEKSSKIIIAFPTKEC
jgi:hypothetical protein